MGLLSPAAYDALLLEKVKLVIQAVMQDPARKTQPMTYEDFVVGFDVAQPLSFKLFDLLLQETAKRRPPRRSHAPEASTSSAGPAARRPRSSRPHSPDPIDMLTGGSGNGRDRSSRLTDFFNASLLATSADSNAGPSTARRRTDVARYGFEQLIAREAAQAAGALASTDDDDISPSTRLRQRQLDELFGPSHPSRDGFDELMGIYNEDGEPMSATAVLERMPTPAAGQFQIVHREGESDLPTYEELWNTLVDEPFPRTEVSSYFNFRIALNSTAQFAASPIRAPGLHELLEELAERDLAFPIRLLNIRAQRARHAAASARQVGEPAAQGEDAEVVPHAPEGIWRASFVEHLEDGSTRDVPVSLGTIGSHRRADAVEAPDAFSAFAERRRAERRARSGGPGDRPGFSVGGSHLTSTSVGSPAAATTSSNSGTPIVTVSNATTPATSAGQSPQASSSSADLRAELSELCPQSARSRSSPPLPPPRAAETSASLAEAHFREQRAIAPLPSHRPTPEPEGTEASRVRTTIPDDILVRVRQGVEAGQLEYDPSTGWTGQGVDGFLPEQLDVVARALVQLRRLRIRGSDSGGVEIEF
ncbi:hypothetical protein BMF94_6250 [Rhodotorula taiwanensis]|uniref:Uncharacterized protein n=1 Tax=Rhodotorula taiwanensis TaxID=741276 RepID=A0A2S5B229_9BASI|nr:hypothetical protein BMF94_6250 [Rhodotorula taiwanensis]